MDRENRIIDPEMLKNAEKIDLDSLQLPEEVMKEISGGTNGVPSGLSCPNCGRELIYLVDFYGNKLHLLCNSCYYMKPVWNQDE